MADHEEEYDAALELPEFTSPDPEDDQPWRRPNQE